MRWRFDENSDSNSSATSSGSSSKTSMTFTFLAATTDSLPSRWTRQQFIRCWIQQQLIGIACLLNPPKNGSFVAIRNTWVWNGACRCGWCELYTVVSVVLCGSRWCVIVGVVRNCAGMATRRRRRRRRRTAGGRRRTLDRPVSIEPDMKRKRRAFN